jgi:GTP-binding protein EngB required for normal cell division
MAETIAQSPPGSSENCPFPADRALASITRAAADLGLAHLMPDIAALQRQLQSRDSLNVAVFGSFKTGKSSFLNHLAGRDVLPVGVVPVTTVVTRLRFGAAERAEVAFLDGARRPVSLADVKGYVSERENPENSKKVAAVEIELPTLRPLAPLQFVDTPGIGSALAHNTGTALQWLPNAGVAIVAISSEAPLSERDLGLLGDLRRHTPHIVLLLTKADLLTTVQRDEVLAFVKRQLRKKWSEELPVYFHSVLPTSVDFKSELEQGLFRPLLQNRAEMAAHIVRHKLIELVDRTLDHARVALAASTQTETSCRALGERLADEGAQFELLRQEFRLRSRDWSADFFDWALNRLQPVRQKLQARMAEELRAEFRRWRMRLPGFLRAWRAWMQAFLARELGEVSRAEAALFQAPLRNAQTHLQRTLQAFHARLAGHVQTALGIALISREFNLEPREPAVPPVDVAFAFGTTIGMTAGLLPLALFRPLVERSLLRKARYELEKNISRLASTWRERVAAEINVLVLAAEQQACDELSGLEHALKQSDSDEPRLSRIVAEIEAWRPVLSKS